MSTCTNLLFHVIYSTKYRKPTIDPVWQDELYGYIGGIFRDNRGVLLKAGGIDAFMSSHRDLEHMVTHDPWAHAHGYIISSFQD